MSADDNHIDSIPYRPSVMRVLRKSFRDAWLHLGLLVAANVAWIILLGLPMTVLSLFGRRALQPAPLAAALGVTALTAAAANAALYHVTNRIARGEAGAQDFLVALRRHFWNSLALLAILVAIATLAGVNLYFYLYVLRGSLWRVIGVMWGYLGLLFVLATVYAYPLLFEQERGALTAIKRSALLFLDNPAYTLALAGTLAAIKVVFLLPAISGVAMLTGLSALVFCFVAAGFMALVANNAALDLLRKYRATE